MAIVKKRVLWSRVRKMVHNCWWWFWCSPSKNSDCDAIDSNELIVQIYIYDAVTARVPAQKDPATICQWKGVCVFFFENGKANQMLMLFQLKYVICNQKPKWNWNALSVYSPEALLNDKIPFIGLKLISDIREFLIRPDCGVDGNWWPPCVECSVFCMDLLLLLFNSIDVSSSPNIFDKWPLSFVFDWLCDGCDDIDARCKLLAVAAPAPLTDVLVLLLLLCICCGCDCIAA